MKEVEKEFLNDEARTLVCPVCGRSTVILEKGTGTVITSLCSRCGKPVRWDFIRMQAQRTKKVTNIRYD